MTTLARTIKERREERNWSVWKLGQEADMGITHIRRIEAGNGCTFAVAMRLLSALGMESVTVKDFVKPKKVKGLARCEG